MLTNIKLHLNYLSIGLMKSGNLKFLEPSGPLQACNGTALPFIISVYHRGVLPIVVRLLVIWKSVSQSPGPGINYTGPREA